MGTDNQERVRLAGVLMALEGSRETDDVKRGDYAWSLALDRAVVTRENLELRARVEELEECLEDALSAKGMILLLDDEEARAIVVGKLAVAIANCRRVLDG